MPYRDVIPEDVLSEDVLNNLKFAAFNMVEHLCDKRWANRRVEVSRKTYYEIISRPEMRTMKCFYGFPNEWVIHYNNTETDKRIIFNNWLEIFVKWEDLNGATK